jgi:hypothetical protein
MDDAGIVEYEREREKWNLDEPATGKKSGCGKLLLYVILGIIIFKIFVEVISILSR